MQGSRAVIYVRVSSADNEKAIGLEEQERRCRDYAWEHGYHVEEVFADQDLESGEERPELRRLRSALWRRSVDVLILTAPDRLFVDTNRLVRMSREIDSVGARMEFVDYPMGFDPEMELG